MECFLGIQIFGLVWFSGFIVFKSSVSVLIFCLVVLSILESVVLKYPTVIVELSISSFNSDSFGFMYFGGSC